MGSAREPGISRATIAQAFLLAVVMVVGMAAAGDAQAKKPPSMCDGIAGAPRGLCVAAERLGCAVPGGKHQKQCDVIRRNYERATGLPPPWIEPVFPGFFVTLWVDHDVYDLDFAGDPCFNGLDDTDVEGSCNFGSPGVVNWPNDIAFVVDAGLQTVVVQTAACSDPSESFPALALLLPGEAFETVVWDVVPPHELVENLDGLLLGSGDTLLVQSCSGNVYKLGNLEMEGEFFTVQVERIK